MKRFILLFWLIYFTPYFAQDGSLDLTFNSTGKLVIPNPNNLQVSPAFYAVAQQSDGKILAAGRDFIVRLNLDGTLDTTFDGDGKKLIVNTSQTTILKDIISIVPLSDGKILISGWSQTKFTVTGTFYKCFGVVKLNSDGSYDTTFDGDGLAICTFNYQQISVPFDMKVQSDGKIVVVGYTEWGSMAYQDFAVARFNANGSLDTTFNSTGKVTFDSNAYDFLYGLDFQSDGKIVVVGKNDPGNAGKDSFFARLNTDGTLDTTFDGDGMKIIAADPSVDYMEDVKIQPDGKILACGAAVIGATDGQWTLIRLNSDGSLDTTFDGDGIAFFGATQWNEYAYKIALQSNGKIIVFGSLVSSSTNDFGVMRLNSDGSVDNSFDGDGKAIVEFGTSANYEVPYAGCLQSDGKILVAGYFQNTAINYAIARLLNSDNATLNTSENLKTKTQIYPNPFTEILNISSENNGLVQFYDTSGKLVATEKLIKGSNSFNKSTLKSGVYIYKIKNTNGEIISSGKIIKQ